MNTHRTTTKNNRTTFFFIAFAIFVIIFLLLGGGQWTRSAMQGNMVRDMANWSWVQILISLGVGFLLGFLASHRKWL